MKPTRKEKSSLKDQVASKMDNMIQEPEETETEEAAVALNLSQVEMIDEKKLKIEGNTYLVVMDYREAVDIEKISQRYNTILNKYDYIVGDWGYDQLRLKGFYSEDNRRAPFEKKISFLEDYLYEYCNFGCAYFVLEKERAEKPKKPKARRQKPTQQQRPTEAQKDYVVKESDDEKAPQPKKNYTKPKPRKQNQPNTGFKIRKTDQ